MKRKEAGAILMVIGFALILYLPTQSLATTQANPLAIDGSPAVVSCNSSCLSQSVQLHVTAGDIVIVQAVVSPESSYLRTPGDTSNNYHAGVLTGVSSPGLSFQERFAYTTNPGSGDGSLVYLYWAIAGTTAMVTVSGQVNNTLSAWNMVAASVSGADSAQPWDVNPSLTASSHWDFNDCNLRDGCTVPFSTTAPQTMVNGIGSEGNPNPIIPPSGFTLIGSANGNGWNQDSLAYQIFSGVQTNQETGDWSLDSGAGNCPPAPTNSCGESALWYVDAIQACSGSCSVTSTATSSSSQTSSTTTSSSVSTTTSSSSQTTSTTTTKSGTAGTGGSISNPKLENTIPGIAVVLVGAYVYQRKGKLVSTMMSNKQTSKKMTAAKIGAVVAALFLVAGGIGYAFGTFGLGGTSPANGTTTTTSAPPPTAASFQSVELAAGQADSSNAIGTCTIAGDAQSFTCTGTSVAVGESYTITAVVSNPNAASEPITVAQSSTNATAFSVSPSGSNPSSLPGAAPVTLVFTATCVSAGTANIQIGVTG